MFPNPDLEFELLQSNRLIIGVDEVGRGSLAGPVAVGACVIDADKLKSVPAGVQDSKLLPEARRSKIASEISSWSQVQVGFAEVAEIEQLGITKALRLAGERAITALGIEASDSLVLLDGSANWLGDFASVRMQVKADRDCFSVAAASVVAKVQRDALMIELAESYPDYEWQNNKGYSSAAHLAALRSLGPTEHHRLSWLSKILSDRTQLF